MSSRPALGLYISDEWLVIAGVDASGEWVEKYGKVKLAVGVVERGEVVNSMALVEALEKLRAETLPRKIGRGEAVVLGVTEQKVFLREFTVPKGAGKLEEVVEAQIKTILPTLPEEVETDWQILGENEKGEVKALLIAVSKQVLDNLVKVIEQAGFRLVRVETVMTALVREIKKEVVQGKDQLFIYQNGSGLAMAYMTNGKVRFSTVVRLDEVNKQGGVARAVVNTVNFVNGKNQGREIKELLVASENGDVEAMVAGLGGIGLTVVRVPSRLVGTRVNGVTVMQPAVGLAMAELDGEKERIDLMPSSFRLRDRLDEVVGVWQLSSWMMMLVTVLVVISLGLWWQSLQTDKTALTAELVVWQQGVDAEKRNELGLQVREFNALALELDVATQVVDGGAEVMSQLGQVVSPGIRLTGLLYDRGKLPDSLDEAGGSWMVTGVSDSRDLVLDFYDDLKLKPAFSGGQLYFGSLERESEVVFRVVGGDERK